MNLTEEPEIVNWPEIHYVFVEKTGPFMNTAPQAWGEVHRNVPAIAEKNQITKYMSLYKTGPNIYRAGVAVAAPPVELPEGLQYEEFSGGKYSRLGRRRAAHGNSPMRRRSRSATTSPLNTM